MSNIHPLFLYYRTLTSIPSEWGIQLGQYITIIIIIIIVKSIVKISIEISIWTKQICVKMGTQVLTIKDKNVFLRERIWILAQNSIKLNDSQEFYCNS